MVFVIIVRGWFVYFNRGNIFYRDLFIYKGILVDFIMLLGGSIIVKIIDCFNVD